MELSEEDIRKYSEKGRQVLGEFFAREYSGFIRKIALKGLKSAKDEEVAEWFVRVGYMFGEKERL